MGRPVNAEYITGRKLPRAVWALGLTSLLMDTSSELIHGLLPIFLVVTLGASATALGVIEGIAEATAQIARVFSGWLSDALGRRKALTVLGYGLAAATKPLFPLANSIGLVLVAVAVIMPIYTLVGDFNTGTSTTPTPPVEAIPAATLPTVPTSSEADDAPAEVPAGVVLGIADPAILPVTEAAQQIATVVADSRERLNIRQEPAGTSPIIATTTAGTVFPVIEVQEAWVGIELATGGVGWVSRQYVTLADR